MTIDFTDKIKPGRTVRIGAGAKVTSTNPKRPKVVVKRPYWVKPFEFEGNAKIIRWKGSAGYTCETSTTNVDAVEDLS